MPCPKDIPQNHDEDAFNDSHVDSDYHRQDEQVNVCLECKNNINALSRRFIRCSSQATITHLKKFVAKKVLSGMDKYKEVSFFLSLSIEKGVQQFPLSVQVDILCNDELLGKDHTLKFVYITRWRFKDPPLRLQFRPRMDL